MDVITKYYNFNRLLLLCIGLWPYQKCTFNKIQMVCMFFVFAQFFIYQVMTFITVDFSVPLLLEILSTLLLSIVFMYKYNTIYLNTDKIKLFLERIKYDWDTLKNPVEIEIMTKQVNIAHWYTKYFTLTMYIIQLLFVMTHYVPIVLDVVVPLTEPRLRRILVVGEMFMDQQKYFHFIMFNIMVSTFLGMTAVVAAETMLMTLIQHVCGLLKVTSYRITRIFYHDSRFPALNSGKKCTVCAKFASAVMIHRSAITFADNMRDCFATSYFILISFGVASLSINLYRLTLVLAVFNKIDMFIISAFICGHFLYMFWCNYAGQQLINYGAEVYHHAYNAQWYTSSVHDQKMMILMLQRSAKPPSFSFSNIFTGSIEGFGKLVSMSLSYFAVIYSVQ